ncbi:cyanate transporter [Bosea rubneri]|uniref:Cyanate transporter n=1 Tax=Bosea rubneri TaxID=3075434 RepID=A0ABU3S977_9HYPH|nr:cyanate transporter [Bosea sp. ZW T0_25]MDU0341276.1 cyanate transporter [Bosea sp. ZW T0_25]
MYLAVVLIGLNLRPFLTGVAPLASDIHAATGLSDQGMSLFASLSMAAMGLCAFLGPAIQRKIVEDRWVIVGALTALGLFSGWRMATDSGSVLIATTTLCALAVGLLQAVFPRRIKAHFLDRTPFAMGLFSACLMGGGAIGAQLSPLIAEASGNWRLGLGWMAPFAVLAAAVSFFHLPSNSAGPSGTLGLRDLMSRPRAWLLMVGFGIVNGSYASIVAWLAPYYQRMGWSSTDSGSLLAVLATSQAIAALALPVLASKGLDRRPWILLSLGQQLVGFCGLAFAPEFHPTLWAVVIGIGMGGAFSLFMVVALDHLENPIEAGALSAFMQGGGFLIAGSFPWIVAALGERAGGLSFGWLVHAGAMGLVAVLACRFRPQDYALALGIRSDSGLRTSSATRR